MSTLTPDDIDFLHRPLHGFLTVAAGPVPPQPRPVWFELADDGTVQVFTEPGSAKVRRLAKDPRASLVVAAPVGERERWISVAGPVTVEPDGARELCDRLAARYWDLDDPDRAADLAAMRAGELVRIVLHPEQVARVGY
ncbi:pyridoxamine 5'-phosphate oxidase family protein [Nocardia sp. NPDC057227]|uniref:pyridoxamine 5'-phosphate oxidase family protein n=1 Tax=Nocardia sp. NPDC057227 TaxID=3346056 RepID=UPI00362C45A7